MRNIPSHGLSDIYRCRYAFVCIDKRWDIRQHLFRADPKYTLKHDPRCFRFYYDNNRNRISNSFIWNVKEKELTCIITIVLTKIDLIAQISSKVAAGVITSYIMFSAGIYKIRIIICSIIIYYLLRRNVKVFFKKQYNFQTVYC